IMKAGKVRLSVYDITGKEVSVLTNEVLKPGSYEVGFDASHLSSGVYYYRIEAGEFVSVKRMVLLK
ncbi:MAG: T9SS type A sorting domain-containing protein, partial [Ignavibacteria bacterium]|nr:T9SS type A sorting domain-containing protein [Ignavibacteriales bacterium]